MSDFIWKILSYGTVFLFLTIFLVFGYYVNGEDLTLEKCYAQESNKEAD